MRLGKGPVLSASPVEEPDSLLVQSGLMLMFPQHPLVGLSHPWVFSFSQAPEQVFFLLVGLGDLTRGALGTGFDAGGQIKQGFKVQSPHVTMVLPLTSGLKTRKYALVPPRALGQGLFKGSPAGIAVFGAGGDEHPNGAMIAVNGALRDVPRF